MNTYSIYHKRYYLKHRAEILEKQADVNRSCYNRNRELQLKARKSRRENVIILLGGKCYFEDEFCDGPLQIDHKYGVIRKQVSYVTKNGTVGKRSGDTSGSCVIPEVLKDPSRFMLLCRLHNNMKGNISYDRLKPVLESMLRIL